MNKELPDYYALADGLWRLDADFSASEVHGIYCGVLSVNQAYPPDQLQEQAVSGDPQDVYFQEVRRDLQHLYQATVTQFNQGDMAIELLLPNDTDALEERLQALQKWCQGFAYGLALSGLKTMNDLPEASREWVEDVVKIGAAGEFDLTDEDASESALHEIEEFIRVGILMMNEEVQPVRGAPDMRGYKG